MLTLLHTLGMHGFSPFICKGDDPICLKGGKEIKKKRRKKQREKRRKKVAGVGEVGGLG